MVQTPAAYDRALCNRTITWRTGGSDGNSQFYLFFFLNFFLGFGEITPLFCVSQQLCCWSDGCLFTATVEEQLLDIFQFQSLGSFSQVHFIDVCVA